MTNSRVMDAVTRKILDSRSKKWKKMTEEECHLDMRKEICRYFAIEFDGKSLEEAYIELQRANEIGANTLYTQCLLDSLLISNVRYEWGDEVAGIVWNCFKY